jgi:hypothetical protein
MERVEWSEDDSTSSRTEGNERSDDNPSDGRGKFSSPKSSGTRGGPRVRRV